MPPKKSTKNTRVSKKATKKPTILTFGQAIDALVNGAKVAPIAFLKDKEHFGFYSLEKDHGVVCHYESDNYSPDCYTGFDNMMDDNNGDHYLKGEWVIVNFVQRIEI